MDNQSKLSEDQLSAIEQVSAVSMDCLAELGSAYLDYSEAEARFLKAKAILVKCKASTLEAEMNRGNIVTAIARTLNLSPGEWVYNKEQCKLVKKDT